MAGCAASANGSESWARSCQRRTSSHQASNRADAAGRRRDVGEQRFKPRLPLARCTIHGRGLPYRLLCGPFHRRGPECIWGNAVEVAIGNSLELVGELIDGLDVVEEPGNIPGNAPEEEREEDRVETR